MPPAFLSSDADGYISLFASEMALVLVAALVFTALAARRLGAWPVPAFTFAAAALLLYPLTVTRYDAVVALTLALAALCTTLGGRYLLLAYGSLGFGAAAKLVPALATLPLVLIRRRLAVPGYAVFFGALVMFFAPALLLGGGGFLKSFAYHAQRGLQVESLLSSVLMKLGWVNGIVFEYGAFEARGRGVELASSLSLPFSGLLLLLSGLAMYREHRAGRLAAAEFPRYAVALILAFMLGSKVLSPQYLIWLLPLLPLCAGGLVGAGLCALFLAACLTTTLVFPFYYGELLNLQPPAIDLLLGRNLLLVVLWALMLFVPARRDTGGKPA